MDQDHRWPLALFEIVNCSSIGIEKRHGRQPVFAQLSGKRRAPIALQGEARRARFGGVAELASLLLVSRYMLKRLDTFSIVSLLTVFGFIAVLVAMFIYAC
jgi:hypothetical protein